MVNIFCWNRRGLNKPTKRRLLSHNLKSNNTDIVGIQETKIEEIKERSLLAISSSITHWITKSSESNSERLLVGINISLFSILQTWILDYSIYVLLQNKYDSFIWLLTFVYGHILSSHKKIFFGEIKFLSQLGCSS
jgi:hypothetical protein